VGRSTRAAIRIALIYLAISMTWILFSDRWLEMAVDDVRSVTQYQSLKGLFFVAGTTLLLFLLQRREFLKGEASERTVRQSSERSLALLNAIPDHMFRIHADGIVLDYRGASLSDFKYEPEQMLQQSLQSIFEAPVGDVLLDAVHNTLRTYSLQRLEFQLHSGREEQVFEARFVPGGEQEVIAIVRNITELTRVTEIIDRAEREKEIVLDSLVEHVIYTNPEMEIVWLNRAAQESTGLTRQELLGRHCYEIWAQRDSPCEHCPVETAIRTGLPAEEEQTTPDGRTWFIRGYPVFNEDGEIIAGIEVTLETTDQKQAELALAESEVRYRSLFESAKDGILLLHEGTILESNRFAAELFREKRAFMLGKTVLDFSPARQPDGTGSDAAAERRIAAALSGNPQFFTWRARRSDGTEFDTEVSLNRIDIEGKVFIQAIIRDITDRIRATQALQQYADRLKLLREVDQAILEARSADEVAAVAVRHLRRVGVCDRASVTLVDTETTETRIIAVDVKGKTALHPGNQVSFQDPETIDALKKAGIQMFPDLNLLEAPTVFIKQLMSEGIRSYVNIPLVAQDELFGVLHIGSYEIGPPSDEALDIAREVANVVSVAVHQASLHDQVHQHVQFLEVRVEERTQELEKANLQLLELDRLKSEFVSNVSHELRTPITNILLYLDLFNQPGREQRSEEFLTILRREARRLSKLIEDLLTISRMEQSRETTVREPHVLDAIIVDAVSPLKPRAAEKGIILEHQMNQAIPALSVNRDQIIQVLTNLITNAISYSERGSNVQVHVEMCQDDGRYVCLTVHNDGSVIDTHDLPHIFERFYRGRSGRQSSEPGTGLGLAISKEIIENHRGQIEVESNPEDGTSFTIWLPLQAPD